MEICGNLGALKRFISYKLVGDEWSIFDLHEKFLSSEKWIPKKVYMKAVFTFKKFGSTVMKLLIMNEAQLSY